jgi:hypothetical protein
MNNTWVFLIIGGLAIFVLYRYMWPGRPPHGGDGI